MMGASIPGGRHPIFDGGPTTTYAAVTRRVACTNPRRRSAGPRESHCGSIPSPTRGEAVSWREDYPWCISSTRTSRRSTWPSCRGRRSDPRTSTLFQLKLDAGVTLGDAGALHRFEGDSLYSEGLAVDACGNLYVSLGTRIYRVSSDGKTADLIWVRTDTTLYARAIAGLEFGRGGSGGTTRQSSTRPALHQECARDRVGMRGKSRW